MNKGLSATSVVAIAVVIILLSASLLYIGFTYPTGVGGIGHSRLFDLFKKQYYDKNGLGRNGTGFRPTLGITSYLIGYVKASNNLPIGNAKLFAAVYPEETDVSTNATGYYSIPILYRGVGTFAFEIQNYTVLLQNVSLKGKTNWLNLTFTPAVFYGVSGTTQSYSGRAIIDASVTFDDFISSTTVFSNSSGEFVTTLPDGNYTAIASAPFYGIGMKNITVNGTGLNGIVIVLSNASSNASFTVSGIVRTTSGLPVSNAYVKCNPFNNITTTNRYGNFTFKGIFGYVTFTTRAVAYITNRTSPILVKYNIPLEVVIVDPVASVGNGIGLLNANSWNRTSIAFFNYSTLSQRLGILPSAGPFSSGGSTINIRLLNGTGNVSGEGYLLYVVANGVQYAGTDYYLQVTNSTGWLTIQLDYKGTFTILLKLLYYHSIMITETFTGMTGLNVSLTPVHVYNVTVNGTDTYNPAAAIGIPHILNTPVYTTLLYNSTKMANITSTTFLLPNGTYEFCTNLFPSSGVTEWVNENVTLRVNGRASSGWLHYREYVFMTHDNSSYGIIERIMVNTTSYGSYSSKVTATISAGSWLNLTYMNGFAAGDYTYNLSFGNGSYNVSGTFVLNSSHPANIINFTGLNSMTNITSGMTYSTANGGTMNVNFSIPVPAGASPALLTNLDITGLNFTLNNSYLSIGSNRYGFSGNFLNLTNFAQLSGSVTAQLVLTGLSRWQESEIVAAMSLDIHMVQPYFQSSYSNI